MHSFENLFHDLLVVQKWVWIYHKQNMSTKERDEIEKFFLNVLEWISTSSNQQCPNLDVIKEVPTSYHNHPGYLHACDMLLIMH